MKIEHAQNDEVILAELGQRLVRMRLDRNETQAQLAEKSGISKRTIERLESGQSIQLSNFIRLCRELDLIERFDSFIAEPIPSPIAQVERQGKIRRRATSHPKSESSKKKWTWDDK